MDIEKPSHPIKVLLIEDNPDDQILTKRMLEKTVHSSFDIVFAESLSTGIKITTDSRSGRLFSTIVTRFPS